MTSLILACIWVVSAQVVALLPTRDLHWRAAYFLIAIGLPILVFVFIENGIWIALLALFAAMSILRYPVLYAYRWMRRAISRTAED